jgi:protein-tyrosine phosphatase
MRWSWPWKRERSASVRFSDLAWDVHSHLVPGVDDGAPDLDAALDMVRGMHALGYKGMVLTPHIMSDLYPNSPETLRPAFESLLTALEEAHLPMQLELAAEYLLEPESLELLQSGELLTFTCLDHAGSAREVVLMEFGFHHAPHEDLVKEALFAAQTRGLTPLLAHCERYPYLHKDDALLELWRERGGWMSVNAASLAGAYGPETRDMAKKCMDRGWVSFLCSDAHGMRHVRALEALATSNTVARWMASDQCLHRGLGV